MQTFLPYSSFHESLKCLDYRRLGKQRVEAKQLIQVTEKVEANPGLKVAWANHPARLMWVGYLPALKYYHNLAITEWVTRGYNNTMKMYNLLESPIAPPWLGNEQFHASHRSNLLRKDKNYYSLFGWTEPDNLPYIWPTTNYVSQ